MRVVRSGAVVVWRLIRRVAFDGCTKADGPHDSGMQVRARQCRTGAAPSSTQGSDRWRGICGRLQQTTGLMVRLFGGGEGSLLEMGDKKALPLLLLLFQPVLSACLEAQNTKAFPVTLGRRTGTACSDSRAGGAGLSLARCWCGCGAVLVLVR